MSPKLPQHRAASILSVGTYLDQRGERPGPLLTELGLSPEVLLGSNIWLPRDTVLRFTHAIETLTGDSLLGFYLGELFELQDYGPWVERLLQLPTLGDALRYVIFNIHQLETGTRLSLLREGEKVRLRSELVGDMASDPRHQYDGHLTILLKILHLTVEPFAITMRLPHDCSRLTLVEELLQLDVSFNCEHAEFVFDGAALELPLTTLSLPPRRELTREEITCREVFRQIAATLEQDRPTAAKIAEQLFLNVRTMQRHMSAWGFSFEQILDGYRKRLALENLLSSQSSVTDIAHGLGYSDAAHFTRAFRRWYGVSPRSARQRAVEFAPARRRA